MKLFIQKKMNPARILRQVKINPSSIETMYDIVSKRCGILHTIHVGEELTSKQLKQNKLQKRIFLLNPFVISILPTYHEMQNGILLNSEYMDPQFSNKD